MLQTLDRSIYEKTRAKKFQNWCVYAADFGSTVSTWCVNDARPKLPGALMMLDLNYLVR